MRPDPISYYDLESLLQSEDSQVLVALMDGRLVGSGSLRVRQGVSYRRPSEHAYLGYIYVRPEYRGQGINGMIVSELLTEASVRGYEEVQLTVYPENNSALRAYKKLGFKPHLLTMRLED